MLSAQLSISFDSEWLIAGGDSTLGTADMAPIRDADGFPTIPGRTLRGLLREAVALVDDCEPRTAHASRLFGTRKGKDGEAGDGTMRIGNALVTEALAKTCTSNADCADLFATVRRTALETGTRTAKPNSLREMEVAIAGLELIAELDCESEADLEVIAFAAGLVRSLGHSRSRGLGRCRMEVWRNGKQINPIALPASAGKGAIR